MTAWLRRGGARQVIVVDPLPNRRQAAREAGATVTIDPTSEDVRAVIRQHMPKGADVSFVCLEDYIPASEIYMALAIDVARLQGSVVLLRLYSVNPYARITPITVYMKEVTLKHFGVFFGNEPLRGGRNRGDWQVTLEALADGLPIPTGSSTVDFADLRTKLDVDDLFEGLPSSTTKAIVKIAGG